MIIERGYAESVLSSLKKIDGVSEAYMAYGVYDVIAKIKADTMDKLVETNRHLQKLDSVRSTQTMIVRSTSVLKDSEKRQFSISFPSKEKRVEN